MVGKSIHLFFYPSAFAALAIIASACGGGGYGGSSSSGGGGGLCGGVYAPCPPTSAGSPSVTLSSVSSTVNRNVTLTATPTAPNGVMRVDFMVDGQVIGMATSTPYSTSWNTSSATDGTHTVLAHVTDNMGLTADSASSTVTVANNLTLNVSLTPSEEYPAPGSAATGTGQFAVNLSTGVISGNIIVSGMTANAAHIHDAFAGNTGTPIITLAQNGSNANRWDVPANSTLTSSQVDRLLAGTLYVNAHSTAFPNGEIRSQIKPSNVQVIFANMTGAQEVPPVTTTASGVAAVTIDTALNKLSVHVRSTGVDDATAVGVYKGASGATSTTPIFALTKDNALAGHWSLEGQDLSAANLTDFNSSSWYVNALTPANPTGEIRGQVTAPSAATTLSQLQSTIFTPHCSGCHTGGGATLPSSMNLTAGNTFASLVNVTSVEVTSLKRVAPNNVAGSYIINKLEGTQTSGARMPFGGPFLDQATIDTVKSWINAGALNN